MSASLSSQSVSDFLESLSAKTPTPGGGAAACIAGALGASLAQMVVSYSLGKKNLALHQPDLTRADLTLARARQLFLGLADEDAAAYGLVNELTKLPETDPRRAVELPPAIEASIQVPMAAIAACTDLLRLYETLAPITNRHLHSDLAIAAVLTDSAARASLWNVRVNAALIPDSERRTVLLNQASSAVADAARRRDSVERACTS
jgi:formiminotetrahydrofolate cyclodeaminase